MKQFIQGYRHFHKSVFPHKKQMFSQLSSSQQPKALLITCADSRIVPDLILQTEPGELFICRNAGNIVPTWGSVPGGVTATIEYAVSALGIRQIVIVGHSDCGAMKAVLNPEMVAKMPTTAAWLNNAESARLVTLDKCGHLDAKQQMSTVTEENVLVQLDHLRTHPCVAVALSRGQLELHGWVYEIETGLIRAYDSQTRKFVSLLQDDAESRATTRRHQSHTDSVTG